MSDDAKAAQVQDVLGLSTTLAEQILHAHKVGHAVSVEQFTAVVNAAEFLHERRVPWPAVVTQAIDILVAEKEAISTRSGDE